MNATRSSSISNISKDGLIAGVVNNVNTGNDELLVNLQGHQCLENSTVSQLNADAYFEGGAWQDTLDYGVLSINVNTDQDSATDGLEIQWSNDGVNPIDYDKFTIYANTPKTFTFGPAERYYKVKYTNGSGGTTTTFHLTSLLRKVYVKPSSHRITDYIVGEDDAELVKAVITGQDPNGIFRNISATEGGSIAVNMVDNYGFNVENTPMGELRVATPVRLVGSPYTGATIDPNFWTSTVTNGGTSTQGSGQVLLRTNTTANGTAKLNSVRRGRYLGGSSMRFRAVIQLTDGETGTADNIRRWGAYDANNGAFFELNGTTLNVVTRKGGADTPVASASWNGVAFTIDLNVHTYEIYWTNSKVWFVVGDEIVHTVSATSATWTETTTLPITIENNNTNGLDTDIQLACRVASIYRLGELETSPTYKYVAGAATTILKYGAGDFHALVNNDNSGSIIIYDNTAGSGTIIASIDLAKVLGDITFNAPFSNGLTAVTTGAGAKVTFIYE